MSSFCPADVQLWLLDIQFGPTYGQLSSEDTTNWAFCAGHEVEPGRCWERRLDGAGVSNRIKWRIKEDHNR